MNDSDLIEITERQTNRKNRRQTKVHSMVKNGKHMDINQCKSINDLFWQDKTFSHPLG